MSRVPPSNIGRPPAPKPQRPQAQQGSTRPRTSRQSGLTAAQKAQEAKQDESVPELKDGAQGAGEGGGGPDWGRHETAEHAIVGGGQEHLDREDRLKAHEATAEEERKEEKEGKVPTSKNVVPSKTGQQKAGQGAKMKQLKAGFEQTSFESAQARLQQLKKAAELQKLQAPPPPRLGGGNLGDAMKALHNAQDHGVFFKEEGFGGANRPDEEQVDPELEAAVEECIRLLFGVQGILRVGPGENDAKEKVVIVVATRGFTAKSLTSVPPKVHRFKTLLALPFDLLPLRRERL